MDIIAELVGIVQSDDETSALTPAVEQLGRKSVRVVAIELLSWLRRQHRMSHEKPLMLNSNHDWCRAVAVVLDTCPHLSRLFLIDGQKLTFRAAVPSDERALIRAYVNAEYKPVLRK